MGALSVSPNSNNFGSRVALAADLWHERHTSTEYLSTRYVYFRVLGACMLAVPLPFEFASMHDLHVS